MKYRATILFLLYKKKLLGNPEALTNWEIFHEDYESNSDEESLKTAQLKVGTRNKAEHPTGPGFVPNYSLVFVSRLLDNAGVEKIWTSPHIPIEDGKVSLTELIKSGLQLQNY